MKSAAYVIIVILAAYMPIGATHYDLPVPWYPQTPGYERWCWAACTQMILQYYGYQVTQNAICQMGTRGVDSGDVLSGTLPSCDSTAVDSIIMR